MTDPYREAREAGRERPGIIYLLLPRAARPDTRLQIDAALPEAAALADPRLTEEYQPGPCRHKDHVCTGANPASDSGTAPQGFTDPPSARPYEATGVTRLPPLL